MADNKKVSLVVKTVDANGDETSKAVTNINPDASGIALDTFAKALVSLTDKTHVSTSRVETTNVTGAQKETPVIFYKALADGYYWIWSSMSEIELSYPGAARKVKLTGHVPSNALVFRSEDSPKTIGIEYTEEESGGEPVSDPTLTIALPATDEYNEASLTFCWANADGKKFKAINEEV